VYLVPDGFYSHSRLQRQYLLVSASYSPYVSLPLIWSACLLDIWLPQTVKEMRASYDALVDIFASFENFLSRLSVYAGIPPTPALTNVLVKIIVELISTLALATKQVKQGRFSEFILLVTTID
jgi:hypothetical protein